MSLKRGLQRGHWALYGVLKQLLIEYDALFKSGLPRRRSMISDSSGRDLPIVLCI
jgi:hypothetical protein